VGSLFRIPQPILTLREIHGSMNTILKLTVCVALTAFAAIADDPLAAGIAVPTGQLITPTAAHGAMFQDLNPGHSSAPDLRARQAAAISVSPDGRTLAILTSGFNVNFGSDGKMAPELSTEYVFLFDITGPQPKQVQVLPVPNAFQGLAWTPSSDRLFASGGSDDTVVEFARGGSSFAIGRTFRLGHKACAGFDAEHGSEIQQGCAPVTGGLAVSPDGTRLLIANLNNDSVSLIDLASGRVVAEQDLRPGIIDPKRHGQPGGSYPRSVAWISADRAYVASERDREIISLAISHAKVHVVRRMPVSGQPVALLANRKGTRLYAALDNADQVAIIDTAHDTVIDAADATAPRSLYANTNKLGGANSNALALTPDERTLLVSNGGENAVAVIRLSDRARDVAPTHRKDRDGDDDDDRKPTADRSAVIGLVPTGWYPDGVATSKDGARWYIVNSKSPTPPNVGWCKQLAPSEKPCTPEHRIATDFSSANGWATLMPQNQYIHQLENGGFLTIPAPSPAELARLTKQVARNDHFDRPEEEVAKDERLFSFLREHIKHVIYIVKENRSYDQVLGDLEIGNGDPRLTVFPERISPNHHAIARNFVTLDNFLVSGEVSWSGWDWSTAAQTNDLREREEPLGMSDFLKGKEGGLQGEGYGTNRNINMGFASSTERKAQVSISPSDPDILPGTHDVYGIDGPGGDENKGYLWDAVLRRGLTLRNFGFFGALPTRTGPHALPLVRDPYAQKLRVFFPTKPALMANSDPYYRSFDEALPDYWRVQEWKREFAAFSASGNAPNLMLLHLGTDHIGEFARALDGLNTPETQIAGNDYAVGLVIETVANSPFAKDTVIISIEDDACDGPDHVDAHRSVTLFAGAYVRQHALVSTRYTTVSVIKTIEAILGLGPIGLNDTFAAPMSDLFDPAASRWSYKAIVPDVLRSTKLPLPPAERACIAVPRRSSEYWTKAMAGQDFSTADRIDPVAFNRALWRGLKNGEPYPATPTGTDLRTNRGQLLAQTASVNEGGCASK
jgi:DNA-binding beta-propeller fold protein YncE